MELVAKIKKYYGEFKSSHPRDRCKTLFGKNMCRAYGLAEAGFGTILTQSGDIHVMIAGSSFYVVGAVNALSGEIMAIPSRLYKIITKKDDFWGN